MRAVLQHVGEQSGRRDVAAEFKHGKYRTCSDLRQFKKRENVSLQLKSLDLGQWVTFIGFMRKNDA